MSIELKLLGPVQVIIEGTPVTPSSRIQRTLLTVLMMQANRVVTTGRLAEVLWDDPPTSFNANLRTHVSGVRRIMKEAGQDRIARHMGGYRMIIQSGELDLDEFRRAASLGRSLIAGGELDQGRAALGRAVALSRAPAGSCLAAQGQLADQLAALDSERLQVFEEWIDVRLQLGEASALVGTVHAHVADNPTRERAWAQLMRAAYCAGDVAAALRAFSHARELLVSQLGIEPGTQLRSLQRAILARDESAMQPARFRRADALSYQMAG
jgi:DNA-binding SARP family transcriptional activator